MLSILLIEWMGYVFGKKGRWKKGICGTGVGMMWENGGKDGGYLLDWFLGFEDFDIGYYFYCY